MVADRGGRRERVDSDGVRVVSTRPWWLLTLGAALAVILALGLLIRFWWRPGDSDDVAVHARVPRLGREVPRGQSQAVKAVPRARSAPGRAPLRAAGPAAAAKMEGAAVERAPGDASEDGRDYPGQPPTPPPSDYGWTGPTGIGLFPPPGTNPPKEGIIVPDDYVLPPGYVRHYQTTDDGKALQPILMFHPDYELVDEKGNPIPVPDDGVVPPELAPPGLPINILEVPEPERGPPAEQIQRLIDEHPELFGDGVTAEQVDQFLKDHPEIGSNKP